jgi:fibronectin type 3 domain-containing protein
MIKRLSVLVSFLLLCSIVSVPGQAARADAARPQAARDTTVIRAGDPDFPAPVELRYDPNAVPFGYDAPLPAARPGLQPSTLSITVDYVANGVKNALGDSCLSYPAAAKTAFDAAAAILQAYISSPVQIRIEACWANLPQYVLGHSSAMQYNRDFIHAPYPGIFYPVALANAFVGSDQLPASTCTGASLPTSNCDDITLAYANAYINDFYFGTDGNPGSKIDFESVVLHEIIHGLGFAGKIYAYQSGGVWYGGITGQPYVRSFDYFASDTNGVSLSNVAVYPRPGTALGNVLVGGNGGAFLNGLNTRYGNGGNMAPLYSPNPWKAGSSYSHLADSFDGTPEALMTWSVGTGEWYHALGPVVLGVLKDAGWAPQPATGLTAGLSGPSQATLNWTNNGGGPTGFRIERSPNGVDTWTSCGTAGASATSFNDSGLGGGDNYYRVVAYSNLGDAYPSNVSDKVTSALAAATALTATPVSDTQINLAWTNNAASATAATVQRSPTGADGTWTTLTTTAAPGSTAGAYTDSGPLAEGTTYYYQVIVTSGSLQSSPSSPAHTSTFLAKPTGLVTSAPPTFTQVKLSWTNHSAHQTGYDVYRADDIPTTFVLKGHSATAAYTDSSGVAGTKYYYKVRATNAANSSADSAQLAVVTPQVAPTNFTAVRYGAMVKLSWMDKSTNETSYTVERSLDGSTGWVAAGSALPVPGTGSNGYFSDYGSFELATQYYRICAKNAVTCSTYVKSAVVAAGTTLNAPLPVSYVALLNPALVRIRWTDNSAKETGYQVQYANSASGPWTDVVAATAANVTSFDWTIANGTYYVRVRALNANAALDSPYTAPFKIVKSSSRAFFPIITK